MSAEQTTPSAYEATLHDLEAERNEIDLLIEAMKRRIAAAGGRIQSGRPSSEKDLSHDAFFNMTVGDGARKYLEIVKQTKSTSDIAQALERGGLKHASKDFNTTIRSTLGGKSEFIRVNGLWGLTEWYPGARKDKKEKPVKAKEITLADLIAPAEETNQSKPNGKAATPSGKSPQVNQAQQTKMFLAAHRDKPYTAQELREAIGAKSSLDNFRTLLSRWAKAGHIKRDPEGGYRVAG